MEKIVVILEPTASGKSALGIEVAKKFNGEIISADSRQVYKWLNIGTGKITKKEMRGVPHHLLDVISPKKSFSVQEFQSLALQKISAVLKKNKLPIIVGGTGFYIQSIVDGISFPSVPPDQKLREKLSKKSALELSKMLRSLDKRRWSEIDRKNPVRLIRAIEIAKYLDKVPKISRNNKYDVLQIGISIEDIELKEKIHTRLISRLKNGMINEAKKLQAHGLSFKRMEELGLEYRYLAKFLKKEITKNELIKILDKEIWRFAKRQKTWFKRDKGIKWFLLSEKNKILKEIKSFIK